MIDINQKKEKPEKQKVFRDFLKEETVNLISMSFELNDAEFEQKPLDSITTQDISSMRMALDQNSMTILKERVSGDPQSFLGIDFPNLFIIESFNYFGTEGIKDLLSNVEFKIAGKTATIINADLMKPTKKELSESDQLLFPNDAVRAKIDYTGSLMVSILVTSDIEDSFVVDNVRLAEIPIAVGSQFCNLTDQRIIQTEDDYKNVGGCPTEYLGYFIINGNKLHFISQNYLKDNTPICRLRKFKAGDPEKLYTNCDLKSRGVNGNIFKTSCYIMNGSGAKLKHDDSKIYIQVGPFVRESFYPTLTSVPPGMNALDAYRLINVMKMYYDPMMPEIAYNFDQAPIDESMTSDARYIYRETFKQSERHFSNMLLKHMGEEVYEMSRIYINNTRNEASITSSEKEFWNVITKINNPAIDSKDSLTRVKDQAPKSMAEFGRALFPHISTIPFEKLGDEILKSKAYIRQIIKQWIADNRPAADYSTLQGSRIQYISDVDLALFYFKGNLENLNEDDQELVLQWNLDELAKREEFNTHLQNYRIFLYDISLKEEMLTHMITRLMRSVVELDPVDDINSLGNQIYEPAGELMLSRFGSMIRDIKMDLLKVKDTPTKASDISNLFSKLGNELITKQYRLGFTNNEWNKITMKTDGKKRTGIRDVMPTTGPIAEISALRRLSSQSSDQSSSLEDRYISGLQTGYVCPAETSEGKQCGRVVHLAAAAIITGHSYDGDVWMLKLAAKRTSRVRGTPVSNEFNRIYHKNGILDELRKHINPNEDEEELTEEQKIQYPISRKPTKDRKCFFMLDGVPLGWVDGLKMKKSLINNRRRGVLNPMTGIHFKQRVVKGGLYQTLKMETRASRIVQPLIIAEDPQKTVNLLWHLYKQAEKGYTYRVADLFEAGYIEFVDSAELEFLDLSPSGSDYLRSIQDGNPNRYDHIMLNPSFIMGFTANMQPFANMNPPVRTSYFTAQVRQPASGISPSFVMRGDTGVSRLLTPQKPIVSTDIYDKVFEDNYFGMNVNILVATDVDNEEDGIVVREGFVKNGGLSSVRYEAYPISYDVNWKLDYGSEEFYNSVPDPDRFGKGIIRVKKQVHKIDPETGEDIIVEEPVVVRNKEVLARAMTTATDGGERFYDEITYDSLREGVVERIMWSKGGGNTRIAYVIIKLADNIWNGDKLTSRFAQKGVAVRVVPDSEMYYDAETGEVPDLIINPQGFPSRMTVGATAEMTVGTAYVRPDLNKTVSVLFEQKGFDLFARVERLFIVNTQDFIKISSDIKDFSQLSQIPYPSQSSLSPSVIMDTKSGKRANPEDPDYITPDSGITSLISSSSVFEQEQIDALRRMDLATSITDQEEGILALRVYGTPKPFEDSLEVEAEVHPTKDIRYILIVLSDKTDQITKLNLTDERVQPWYRISPELRARIAFVLEVPRNLMEDIPDLFIDTETDYTGIKKINHMKGVRITKLPKDNLSREENILGHLGNSVQQVYVRGNTFMPVARQAICAYKDEFFRRGNLDFYFIDYIIPDNMLVLDKVKLPDQEEFSTFNLPKGTLKMSILNAETTKVKAIEQRLESTDVNAKMVDTEIETTLAELWIRKYDNSLFIPREYVIDLPESPSDLFKLRRDRLEYLRKGNAFKENADLSDAKKELSMMGYKMDLTKRFMDPRSGKEVNGGLVMGSVYYMAPKHKVKDKVQARGIGTFDMRLGQPNKGKANGGGIRFNFQDSTTIRRTGSNAVLLDRLRDASGGKNFFICQDCQNYCYKISHGREKGSTYCRSCKTQGNAVRVHMPYVTQYMMNLLKGAGMSVKTSVRLLEQNTDE